MAEKIVSEWVHGKHGDFRVEQDSSRFHRGEYIIACPSVEWQLATYIYRGKDLITLMGFKSFDEAYDCMMKHLDDIFWR